MKRFKFRLEAVEKVRKRNEEDAMRVLADARRRLSELVTQGEKLTTALDAAAARKEDLGRNTVNSAQFAIEEDFIAGTKLRIAQLAPAVSRAKNGVEKATRFFLHARRQLHVITRLRERDLEAFNREQSKREQKEIDEMVVMRANRTAVEDTA